MARIPANPAKPNPNPKPRPTPATIAKLNIPADLKPHLYMHGRSITTTPAAIQSYLSTLSPEAQAAHPQRAAQPARKPNITIMLPDAASLDMLPLIKLTAHAPSVTYTMRLPAVNRMLRALTTLADFLTLWRDNSAAWEMRIHGDAEEGGGLQKVVLWLERRKVDLVVGMGEGVGVGGQGYGKGEGGVEGGGGFGECRA